MPGFATLRNAGIKLDANALAAYFRSEDGPVLRKTVQLADAIKADTVAKLNPNFPRRFLAPTIVKRVSMTDAGPRILLGSEHTRTRPHVIQGNPVLVFNWPKAGGVVFLRHVNHPGSDFTRYLVEKLLEAALEQKGKFR